MKILAGELEQTDGEIQLQSGLKLGMLILSKSTLFPYRCVKFTVLSKLYPCIYNY